MSWTLAEFEHNARLVPVLAAKIAQALSAAVQERGRASLAVSGGSTPRSLFEHLSQLDIPWSSITVTLVDERWVPETDVDSNALLVRRHLLQHRAARARFIGLKTEAGDPFLASFDVEARLRTKVLPLDVAVLGMGEDGHTASFFPAAEGLETALSDAQRACCGIRPPLAPHPRMTLTLSTLLGAGHLFLHITGATKRDVLAVAMSPGSVHGLPVRAVLHQSRVPLEIHYAEKA